MYRKYSTTKEKDMEDDKIFICCFCGGEFHPWTDSYGDLNENACVACDMSYEDGQFNDRELGCS